MVARPASPDAELKPVDVSGVLEVVCPCQQMLISVSDCLSLSAIVDLCQ